MIHVTGDFCLTQHACQNPYAVSILIRMTPCVRISTLIHLKSSIGKAFFIWPDRLVSRKYHAYIRFLLAECLQLSWVLASWLNYGLALCQRCWSISQANYVIDNFGILTKLWQRMNIILCDSELCTFFMYRVSTANMRGYASSYAEFWLGLFMCHVCVRRVETILPAPFLISS